MQSGCFLSDIFEIEHILHHYSSYEIHLEVEWKDFLDLIIGKDYKEKTPAATQAPPPGKLPADFFVPYRPSTSLHAAQRRDERIRWINTFDRF